MNKKWPFENLSIETLSRYLKGNISLEELSVMADRTLRLSEEFPGSFNLLSWANRVSYEDFLEDSLEIIKRRYSAEEISYFLKI